MKINILEMKLFKINKVKLLTLFLICFSIFYIILKILVQFNDFKYRRLGINSNHAFQSSFNTNSIEYIINSNICLYKKPKIVILVTSHVESIIIRNTIRRSYPNDIFIKYSVQIIFLLALNKYSTNKKNNELQIEFKQHQDIVQGNFIEDYRNLTLKHLMGLLWIQTFCNSVEYVIKMDDDIVINYYKLFDIINKYKPKFHFMGHVIKHMKPIRDITNKWYVSEIEYEPKIYPSFVSGWCYITTLETVKLLLSQVNFVKLFWVDDVFITGILREKSNIKLIDLKQWYRYEPKIVECCILQKYSCDFLVAPNGKDYSLKIKLNNHLWKCRYKEICHLKKNINHSCLLS